MLWKRGDRVEVVAGEHTGAVGTIKSLSHSDTRGDRMWVVFDRKQDNSNGTTVTPKQIRAAKVVDHPTEVELLFKRLMGK